MQGVHSNSSTLTQGPDLWKMELCEQHKSNSTTMPFKTNKQTKFNQIHSCDVFMKYLN